MEPWYTLALDHVGPLNPIINGNRFILTVKDLFTRWVEFFPVPNTKAGLVIKALANELFIRYEVPFEILTGNAQNFVGAEFTKFLEELGITLNHSAPYNPKANFS